MRKMKEARIPLAGAVHEYTDPATGKDYLYFPIRKIHRNEKISNS